MSQSSIFLFKKFIFSMKLTNSGAPWLYNKLYMKSFMLFVLISFIGDAHSQNYKFDLHPIDEFSSHTIIKPKLYHGKHKNLLSSTKEEDGTHATHIVLTYNYMGKNIVADLYLKNDLIPHGHFLQYQKPNGGHFKKNLNKTELNLCHYQGALRRNYNSFVALSTCNAINGIIFDGIETFYFYSGMGGNLLDEHYLFRNADNLHNKTCGYGTNWSHRTTESFPETVLSMHRKSKRSVANIALRGPYDANLHSSIVELVIVVDKKVYKSFGESIDKVHHHCKDIANIVNALYVPLNIFIALVGVVVWNEYNEIELSSDGDATLKNFLHYRKKVLAEDHPNDNAQLLTKEQFEGGVVGKALKGPICTFEYSGGVSMEHSEIVAVVATTVAHEMGHNFGMEHDSSDCKCVDEKCIMSASSTSIVPRHWSSCSIDQLNVAFSHGMNYCLRNKPKMLFEPPNCGNGFVEAGEQCDCGLPEYCKNTCCNPNTCMLHSNASCATGECCDLTTCAPKSSGIECRSSKGECDLPEYCTGESEYCPNNVYKRDTELCNNGNAFCYEGTCGSRSNQCKILWGPSGESSDHCYGKNIEGSRHGNCGYDRLLNHYLPCKEEDVYCGMLHCRHLNERLEFGMESVAVLSHSFMNHDGSIIPCRTAIVDLGLESIDPGLTPNGAKCGNNKMCVNQKCVTIASLHEKGKGVSCPEMCNGQGICNSQGHCHCFVGFAPPFCNNPGQGGSDDSGPATNPNNRIGFTRAMYIFFLGIVPTISLFFFFTYYWRQNRPFAIWKASVYVETTVPLTKSKPEITNIILTSSTNQHVLSNSNEISKMQSSTNSSPKTNLTRGTSLSALPKSITSITEDTNSSLLKTPSEVESSTLNNTMFGKFKGFTLRPLPSSSVLPNSRISNIAFVHPVTKACENNENSNGIPLRSAPAVPKLLTPKSYKACINIKRGDSKDYNFPEIGSEDIKAPALPPPNPCTNSRPIISYPIFETSTCTAKEIFVPEKNTQFQSDSKHQMDDGEVLFNESTITSEKTAKVGTIKRIASFLKNDDKHNIILNQKQPYKIKPVIDREKLKNIEISAPIPLVEQLISNRKYNSLVSCTENLENACVLSKKYNGQNSCPMLQAKKNNRPKSVVGIRPKSPPPGPPTPPISITNYDFPKQESVNLNYLNEYDNCETIEASLCYEKEKILSPSSDNIYSVIEEQAILTNNANKLPTAKDGVSGSNDSMGLLGEIVNEIEKRNVDSIYGASTLKYKDTPINIVSDLYNHLDDAYIISTCSTTSSGYLRPSAINTPIARVAPTLPSHTNNLFSNFESEISTANPYQTQQPNKDGHKITVATSENINFAKNQNSLQTIEKLMTANSKINSHNTKFPENKSISAMQRKQSKKLKPSLRDDKPNNSEINEQTSKNDHPNYKFFNNAKYRINHSEQLISKQKPNLGSKSDDSAATSSYTNKISANFVK